MEIQNLPGWMIFQTYLVQYSALVNSIKVLQRKVKEIQQ